MKICMYNLQVIVKIIVIINYYLLFVLMSKFFKALTAINEHNLRPNYFCLQVTLCIWNILYL